MKRLIGVLILLTLISGLTFWLASLDQGDFHFSSKEEQGRNGARVAGVQGSILLGQDLNPLKTMSKRYEDLSVSIIPSLVHLRSIGGREEDALLSQNGEDC
ncbi:MAG: hypothetical protein HC904_00220 [Blastochloris sp.]|nr:hypothetical protein [Blastochloris sp.]